MACDGKEREEKRVETAHSAMEAGSGSQSSEGQRKRKHKRRRADRAERVAAGRRENGAEADDTAIEGGEDRADTKEQVEEGSATAAMGAGGGLFNEEELHCVVCLDFPRSVIYQCCNGHLLCEGCFVRVVEGNQPVCPTCRASLSRDRPIRSRFAETVLSALPVPCSNAESGCSEQVRFGQLAHHLASECRYRRTECKYHALGCDWAGVARCRRRHQRDCNVKDLPVNELLAGVQRRNEQQAARQRLQDRVNERYVRAAAYLSKRCKDIQVRDVVIEHDTITRERCAATFVACGKAWQVFLDPMETANAHTATDGLRSDLSAADAPLPTSANTADACGGTSSGQSSSFSSSSSVCVSSPGVYCRMHVTCVSPIRRRCVMLFVFLRGPSLTDIDFHPHITKIIFKRRRSESDSFRVYLPSDDSVRNLYARDAINLRVAMVDASRGRVRRRFGGRMGGGGAAGGGDDSSDSDSDHSSEHDELGSLDSSSSDVDSDESSDGGGHHAVLASVMRRRAIGGSVTRDGSSVRRLTGLSHIERDNDEDELEAMEDELLDCDDDDVDDEYEDEDENEDEEQLDADSLSSGEVHAMQRYAAL